MFKKGENAVVFIGHSTVLIHLNETNILTDPILNNWLVIFPRTRKAGLKPEELPKIDAIAVSHTHRDHLDAWTMNHLPKDAAVLISKGNGQYPQKWGFNDIRELEPGEKTIVKGVKITAVKAIHGGARNSAFIGYPHALGYVFEGKKTVYFSGDSALFSGFSEIGKKYKIDVALLPIGAYRPYLFLKRHHMSPADALKAMEMLGAKEMVPIHWGSFRMALDEIDESKDALLKLLRRNKLKERVHVLQNGEKYSF